MNSDLYFDGKKFISSSRAAKISGYVNDYIGQLCRDGKLDCRMVGRSWYVSYDSLQEHRKLNNLASKNRSKKSVVLSTRAYSVPESSVHDVWRFIRFQFQFQKLRLSQSFQNIKLLILTTENLLFNFPILWPARSRSCFHSQDFKLFSHWIRKLRLLIEILATKSEIQLHWFLKYLEMKYPLAFSLAYARSLMQLLKIFIWK